MRFSEQQIQEFSRMFDDIITSDSVAVRDAFQRLALISALARDEHREPGPFEHLVRQLDWLETEMNHMKRSIQILQNNTNTDTDRPKDYSIDPVQVINLGAYQPVAVTSFDLTGIQPLTTTDIITLTDDQC